MRKQLPLLVLLLLPLLAWAQTVTVPQNVYFADVHLKISDGAQKEIQKKVDALHRNQSYFKIKVDLANAYFPIIERVFKQEGVPDDFKYLALQESGLIGDAVSTSNAVGYWQFKKEAASDFNLRMDNMVDERRHIIEASRGAALYFKRSNKNYDNWFTSLLSYYLGYSGVQTYSKPADKGAKKMDVTEKSHPYVLTFLAHKIAYDNFVGKEKPSISLREMRATPGQSLTDIALSTRTDYAELERYNKWLLGSSIPSDKDYYVIIPVRSGANDSGLLASKEETPTVAKPVGATQQTTAAAIVKRNGLNALIARQNDTKDRLALQAGISTNKFLKYNDLHNFDEIIAGSAYYIEKKNTTADTEYHVVQAGETMQLISQHYGIRLNYLRYKNRMNDNEVPVPGRVLWLQKRRPASSPVEVRDLNAKQNVVTAGQSRIENKTVNETSVVTTEDDEPKGNIFTRFFNSFKKHKPETEVEETAPVAQTTQVTNPAKEEQPTTATENTTATQKPAGILYPSTNDKLVINSQTETKTSVKAEVKPTQAEEVASEEAEDEGEMVLYQEPENTPAPVKTVPKEATPVKQPVASQTKYEEKEPAVANKPKTQPSNASNNVSATDSLPIKTAKHVVSKGESLYSISKIYAVTVADLTAWNRLESTALKLGQELIVVEPIGLPETKATPVAQSPAKAASSYHTVVAGESLYKISKLYNVTIEDLRSWNNLTDNNLKLGQELKVSEPEEVVTPTAKTTSEDKPAASPTSTSGSSYHTVAAGESMYQISRKYGVTIKDIMEWNKKSDFNVAPGEKLFIRTK